MRAGVLAVAATPSPGVTGGVAVLGSLLDQLVTLLLTLGQEAYVARPAPAVSGSVGEHLRHTLDHVIALLRAASATTLSYDHRERGGVVERDPSEALLEVMRLRDALGRWIVAADAPLQVETRLTQDGAVVTSWSTRERELAFVINHTIHHCALMAVLLAWQGIDVPPRFGYAPSTPG